MIYRARALLILAAIVAAVIPVPPRWVERFYSDAIYPAFQRYVTVASNVVPFALLDLFAILGVLALLASITRDWRTAGARRALGRCAARLVTTAAITYLLFLGTWGLNYRRVPLEAKVDFDRARISPEAAKQLATAAIAHANSGYLAAHAAQFQPDTLEQSFAEAQMLLGSAHTATTGRPKVSLLGLYFRYAAIDGMTVPVLLEVILNPDVLPVERPTVLAHEWAHLAGYADESEANLVAWIAAVRSHDPVAQYSAWLDAYTLTVNALPRSERASLPPLDEGPRADLRNIAARYARSSPMVRTAARGMYDSYLKANRIEEGVANYGLVLQLLLGTRFDDGWKPRLSSVRPSG